MKKEKVGIACVHLVRGSEMEYHVIKTAPLDDRDTGEVVMCKTCKETGNINIDDFVTICEHCLKKILKNKKEIKEN